MFVVAQTAQQELLEQLTNVQYSLDETTQLHAAAKAEVPWVRCRRLSLASDVGLRFLGLARLAALPEYCLDS